MSKFSIDQDYLRRFNKIGIAFSGGLDSSVLLDSVAQFKDQNQLVVLHINHGINKDSDDWEIFCRKRANELGIEFKSWKLGDLSKISEELLRDKRQQCFAEWSNENDLIITGHHSDDQVETVLFRIFRGTGLKGLGGINKFSKIKTLNFYRPLIGYKKEDLLGYAKKNNLIWIEDDSNQDSYFSRNLIRNEIIPKINKKWPFINQSLEKITDRASKAQTILLEVAHEDLEKITSSKDFINKKDLTSLSLERLENLISYWLINVKDLRISSGQMAQIISTILKPSEGTSKFLTNSIDGKEYQILVTAKDISILPVDSLRPLPDNICLNWNLKDSINIPSGELSTEETLGKGLDKKYLCEGAIIRARTGGEKCKPFGRNKSQKIKNLFQEFGIPAWKRDSIPLIYINKKIAAVGDLWVCDEFHTSPHEKGVSIIWNQTIN